MSFSAAYSQNTLSLLSSLTVKDQGAHPYKITSKIIIFQKRAEYEFVYLILMLNGNKISDSNSIKHFPNLIRS
jgi:hypothetical protein